MLVVSRSGSGKTTLMIKLLNNVWLQQFSKIYIFCPTYCEDNKWRLFDKYLKTKQVEVIRRLDPLEVLNKWQHVKRINKDRGKQKLNVLFYFDDCGSEEGFKTNNDSGILNRLSSKGNHAGISCIFVVQKFTQVIPRDVTGAGCPFQGSGPGSIPGGGVYSIF